MTDAIRTSLRLAIKFQFVSVLLLILNVPLIHSKEARAEVVVVECVISVQSAPDDSFEELNSRLQQSCQSNTDPRSSLDVASQYREDGYIYGHDLVDLDLTLAERDLVWNYGVHRDDTISLFRIESRNPLTASVVTISTFLRGPGGHPPRVLGLYETTTTLNEAVVVNFSAGDADGDELQYWASSTNVDIATVAPREPERYYSGSTITVTPVNYGSTTILVWVSDGNLTTGSPLAVNVEAASIPVISISQDAGTITEGGVASFRLTANPPPVAPLQVVLTVSETGDFAEFIETELRTVTISIEGTGTLEVETTDDEIGEGNGKITATVNPGEGYEVPVLGNWADVFVNDNDDSTLVTIPSDISISSDSSTIDEGDTATFTFMAEPPPTTPLEVAVTVIQSGDFTTGDDIGSRTVIIDTDGTGTLSVRTMTDTTDEEEGSITVTVDSGEGYSSGSSVSVAVRQTTSSQTDDVSYVWDCENNDDDSYSYDVNLECELAQTTVNMSLQEVVQSYQEDGYSIAPASPTEESGFNERYSVEGCTFLFRRLTAGTYRWSDVVVCPVPLSEPVDSRSPQQQAVEGTVAAVAAATVSNVTSNIGARFSAPNTGGASVSLAGMPVVFDQSGSREPAWTSLADPFDELGEDAWQSRHRSLTGEELLGSSSFEIALGASQGSNGNPTDVGPQVTVWGRSDFQVFESGGGQNSGYDGDLVAGYLGADFNTGGSWLVGMALSRIKAEADYTLGGAGDGGTLEAELTNLHPYARFALNDRSEAWTILGLGKGEVTDSAQGGSTSKSDLSMQMMSAGARHLLNSFIGIDWALLGDGSLAKVNTSKGVEAVDGISASVWRVRAGVEASYTSVWEGGSALTTFLEIAGRQDGGASAKGRGLELSPGLAFSDAESGFSIEARGRALVLHSADDHREYGASLTASLAPGTDGTGLSLAMTPTWGTPANSLDSVDASLFPQEVVEGRADSLSLNSRVAYGFAAGPGLLSPFAEFSLHDSDSYRTRVGSRYSLGPSVDLELSGDRTKDGTGSAEHSVQFRTRIGF